MANYCMHYIIIEGNSQIVFCFDAIRPIKMLYYSKDQRINGNLRANEQCFSSEKSSQSGTPLHLSNKSMHLPFPHSNCHTEQVLLLPST